MHGEAEQPATGRAGMAGLIGWTGRVARSGAASVASTVVLSNMLRIVSTMVLTRLLSADAYGVVGIITSVAVTLQLLSDVGIYPYLVRDERASDPAFLDRIWTLRLIRSLVLAVVMALLSWPLAMFMEKPEIQPALLVWSATFIFDGLSSLAFATGVREGRLWRVSFIELGAAVAQLGLAIALVVAFGMRSYWALVIAMLAGQAMRVVLSYTLFSNAARRWRPCKTAAVELWGFSRAIALSSMITLVLNQADKLVLARLLPLTTFGMYALATSLAVAPAAVTYTYASRVLYPMFAREARERPAELARAFYAGRKRFERLYALGVGGLIGAAPLIVELLYDDRYRSVTWMFRVLLVSSFLLMGNWAADQLLVAMGRVRATLIANIGRMAWLSAGGVAGYLLAGPIGLVWCVGTVELGAMACYWWQLRREGLLRFGPELGTFAAGAVGMALGLAVGEAGLLLIARLA